MGNYLIIDLTKCFECNEHMDENHHVVPRSKGGKRTIPLCGECHGKAHGIGRKRGFSKLIKAGLAKTDKKLGRPKLSDEIKMEIKSLSHLSNREIGRRLKISHTAVSNVMKE